MELPVTSFLQGNVCMENLVICQQKREQSKYLVKILHYRLFIYPYTYNKFKTDGRRGHAWNLV